MRLIIFGSGRVGLSLAHYGRSLGLETDIVTRAEAQNRAPDVRARIERSDLVAAAIPDDFLPTWFANWKSAIGGRPAIHFSGARVIDGMLGYHPLYSFPKAPLAPEIMAGVAIVRERGTPTFARTFPGARNPELEVEAADRALYHALAVLSGNFAAHLWNETAKVFADRLGAPPALFMTHYLAGVVERFREDPFDSLTGPVARQDAATIEANLAALSDAPALAALYRAFLESAWPTFRPAGEIGVERP